MTIEIHEPELETLIKKWMDSGEFANVEDALRHALLPSAKQDDRHHSSETIRTPARTLIEAFERGQGLGEGVDFSRIPSTDRPVDL